MSGRELERIELIAAHCKASVSIEINKHRDYYRTAKEEIDESDDMDETPKAIIDEMIATDTIVSIAIYPHTPIGFYQIYDSQLSRALDRAMECIGIGGSK